MAVRTAADLEAARWRLWWQAADDELAAEHGFLSATGLTWLGREPVEIPGIPGLWSVDGGAAFVELAIGEELEIDGVTAAGAAGVRHQVPTVRAGQPSPIRYGEVVIEVLAREEGTFVRPRDPGFWRRHAFGGTPAFAYDPAWRLAGEFTPAAAKDRRLPEVLTLPSVMPGLTNSYRRAGTVAVSLGGELRILDLVHHRTPGVARLIFRDLTSGVTTYRHGRYLDLDLPGPGAGEVVVDFNRARSFPCSHTDAPTCPTAPARNVLQVEVRAGARDGGGED